MERMKQVYCPLTHSMQWGNATARTVKEPSRYQEYRCVKCGEVHDAAHREY